MEKYDTFEFRMDEIKKFCDSLNDDCEAVKYLQWLEKEAKQSMAPIANSGLGLKFSIEGFFSKIKAEYEFRKSLCENIENSWNKADETQFKKDNQPTIQPIQWHKNNRMLVYIIDWCFENGYLLEGENRQRFSQLEGFFKKANGELFTSEDMRKMKSDYKQGGLKIVSGKEVKGKPKAAAKFDADKKKKVQNK